MKNPYRLVVVAALFALAAAGLSGVAQEKQPDAKPKAEGKGKPVFMLPGPPKWEYKVVSALGLKDKDHEEALNRLGDEGWELVSGVITQANPHTVRYVLKRPKR